jgi:putative ABC transport system permease protein
MTITGLSLAYLRDRLGQTLLNILLLALGVGTIVVLLLFSQQMQNRLEKDSQGIDLVVGAKGSPLQLILSTIFHADVPTGNIQLSDAEQIAANPLIAKTIPLALGDSFRGHRIIGTEHSYVAHYGATLAQGRLWEKPFEATLGSDVVAKIGIQLGDQFIGTHGIGDSGEAHADHPYTVVGVLKPTGTVLDRLVLVNVQSVWDVHAGHGPTTKHQTGDRVEEDHDHDHDHGHKHDHDHDHAHEHSGERDITKEITALLVSYRTPLAAVRVPVQINQSTSMQAAVPALETARLFALVGVGVDVIRGFAYLLMATAALGIFVALYASMSARAGDIALLRVMGATRGRVLGQVLFEGVLLAALGTALGLALGHGAVELAAQTIPQAQSLGLSGWRWLNEETYVVLGALALGALAALIPALRAYRVDIAGTLAKAA